MLYTLLLSGHLVLLSWSVHSFFLWLHQIVDLATPNVFAMSMILSFQRNDGEIIFSLELPESSSITHLESTRVLLST